MHDKRWHLPKFEGGGTIKLLLAENGTICEFIRCETPNKFVARHRIYAAVQRMQIARGITDKLIKRAETEAVVILEGARATGKTTIAHHLVKIGAYTSYRRLSDETAYEAAKSSPADFVSQLPFGTIIDEAQ